MGCGRAQSLEPGGRAGELWVVISDRISIGIWLD